MKDITIKNMITKKVKSTINILEHLVHVCPKQTELIEEQIANLEQVVNDIELRRGR